MRRKRSIVHHVIKPPTESDLSRMATDADLASIIDAHRAAVFACELEALATPNKYTREGFMLVAGEKAERIAVLRRHHTIFRNEGDIA